MIIKCVVSFLRSVHFRLLNVIAEEYIMSYDVWLKYGGLLLSPIAVDPSISISNRQQIKETRLNNN